ncbi:CD225/dispanin family protein [Stackebrandtia nassauensis]|uniref:Interferon-induced transmembrane protein n=1 Tax=Stackebrandtia nassauensis (strain DSM 44728 / CIP 108903 / NRRL B-16338 / NBRC 102104 / LLR-40K-21) TaxID=446470 RepID=D3Q5I0_STANL|nr:CD225/dispanin family protein [Stackebrandtia nassauensis]ADD46040.1 Interferon-induced transmembrane protein [Stackebrandtia nassauensis DSM 44728]
MSYQQPGYPQQPGYGQQPGGAPPSNYMVGSIIAIFCCWPFAIPAIINASKVNSAWAAGDANGAQQASEQAKKWMTIAFIAGAAWVVLWLILYFVLGAALFGLSESYDPNDYSGY